MATVDYTDPLICYCGKPTKVYDCLFRRNFCDGDCSENLRIFLGGTDKVVEINKAIIAGDFRISGSTVVLNETLQKHQVAKASSIDKIDAQVQADLALDKERAALKKIGLNDTVIEAMLKAKGLS
jgi:hypothetical protein